jgi:hypothetical protein
VYFALARRLRGNERWMWRGYRGTSASSVYFFSVPRSIAAVVTAE